MKKSNLVICRAFRPEQGTDRLDAHFLFVDTEYKDAIGLLEITRFYGKVYVEEAIFNIYKDEFGAIDEKLEIIPDFVNQKQDGEKIKVAFLASNDTHVQFMLNLAKNVDEYIFIIPDVVCKDEAAKKRLEENDEKYIEIHYSATSCEELIEFNPDFVFCAADWTSEFLAVKRVLENTDIKMISLQEGPQDWHFRIWNASGRLIRTNHYRNADVILSTGPKTFNYIRPKYFSAPGNPKIAKLDNYPVAKAPKVLINCNFTYLETKPPYERCRELWMNDVIGACKDAGIEYMISKHPRDDSEWPGEPIINSNAFVLKDQILDSSICISRFSSVSYEAAVYGRDSIYYNVGYEPMATFQDESDAAIPCIYTREELTKALVKHKEIFDAPITDEMKHYLNRHLGLVDGEQSNRIINLIRLVSINSADITDLEKMLPKGKHALNNEQYVQKVLLDPKENVVIATHTVQGEDYWNCLRKAEELAETGKHVFLFTKEYPCDFGDFIEYENHQSIEIVNSKDFMINLCGIKCNTLFLTEELFGEPDIVNHLVSQMLKDVVRIEVI